jgi:hypothetical protein
VFDAAVLVWPLLGVHRILVAEQGRLLEAVSFRFEAARASMHRQVDDADWGNASDVHRALEGLKLEQEALESIPT